MHPRLKATLLTASLLLAGCVSIPAPELRMQTADRLAADQGWQAELLSAGRLELMSYIPLQPQPAPLLTVYIEGDGFAWRSRSSPSTDPTPLTPTGLALALQHPAGNVAYLARPGQYTGGLAARGMEQAYWTRMRFSAEVIDASSQALDTLKLKLGATQLQLVGYSGGGAIAALLAARRHDVVSLITVAGNLDHEAWTRLRRITPLTGSLNPADFWQALTTVPQLHLVGAQDRITGPAVAQAYGDHFPRNSRPAVIEVPDFGHSCCWAEQWPTLYNRHIPLLSSPQNEGR